ncbi:MAG: hypothetical protein JJU00_13615 [Opitutales bacterium]|nr:hypothetical protein [Opitutales bacterium]
MKRFPLLLAAVLTASSAAAQSSDCIEFEGFSAGTSFSLAQTFVEAGIPMTVGTYTNGSETFFLSAFISPNSPHQGQSLGFSTATVQMEIGCAEEVLLHFANSAAGVNVGVNGQLEIPKSGNEVLEIGGVTVIINTSGSTGTMRFLSTPAVIESIVVGGEEFFVDNVCILRCGGNDNCFDFEEIAGQTFRTGEFFIENGRVMEIRNLPGQSGGEAIASQGNEAGHLGTELFLLKSTAFIDLGCAGGLSLRAQQGDPGVFLAINGDSATTQDLASFHNQSLGGVAITIVDGVMTFAGEISTFEIGGSAVYIDHLCVAPCYTGCIDFETQTPGAEFGRGDILVEDGITMEVGVFGNDPRLVIEEREQRAGHLGQDAALFDATLTFGIPCAGEISLHFGQYADEVTVGTDVEKVTATSLLDLDGMEVGGALISVSASQIDRALIGTLRAVGNIAGFTIGGTEIVIDHVCHVPCPDPGCVDFETFPLGQTFSHGDVFFEESTRMTVGRYTGPSAPALVTIGNDNFAGGGGKEAILDDAQITFDFLCAQRVEFAYAIVPGGLPGVRLGVNGSAQQVHNFTMLHGDVLGGAGIQVTGTSQEGRVVITSQGFPGGISSVLIGGNDLAIDNICHIECTGGTICGGFGALPGGAVYSADDFDSFEDGGLIYVTAPYLTPGNDLIEGGDIRVSTEGKAGFSDKELHFRNATATIVGCMTGVSFRFGEYGDEIRLNLNDDQTWVPSLAALNGTTLGGVGITVQTLPAPGGTIGFIRFNGQITTLEVGGNDFYIDQLCHTQCTITPPPDPLQLGRAVIVSAVPINATQRRVIIEVEIEGTGTAVLERSNALGPASAWTPQSATVTTPAGQPNVRRFTADIPLSEDRVFFRVRVDP